MSFLECPLESYGIDSRVIRAIRDELEYQDNKWGADKQQSLPGYMIIIQNELNEAVKGWTKDLEGRESALHELVQVIATAIRAVNTYGTVGCARATYDEPVYVQKR